MSTGHRARQVLFRLFILMGLWLYTFQSTAHARPAIYLIYITEPTSSAFPNTNPCIDELLKPKGWQTSSCLVATSLWNKKKKPTDAVDATGDRFTCKNKYWYDLTCKGNPQAPAPTTQELQATVLIDVSQSMRYYDEPKNGTCQRAQLVQEIHRQNLGVKLYWHAEQMSGEVAYKSLSDGELTQQACRTVGDNRLKEILARALKIHGNSPKPIFIITDASEQKPEFTNYLRNYQVWRSVASSGGTGYKEVFIPNWQLRTTIISLIQNPR